MTYGAFYHYTNIDALKSIFNQHSNGSGLIADRRFITIGHAHNLPDKAYDGAIWGMLSPRPEEFTTTYWHKGSNFFSDCLQKARSHLEPTFLLKAQLSESDDVYVADWGVHLREAFEGTMMKNKRIVHETKKAYWDSLIPLAEYKDGDHKLPEVICFSDIPRERISIDRIIACSEMERYINTGEHDPSAVEKDKLALKKLRAEQSKMFRDLF